jgi:type VI protein secretion system component VasF
VCWLDEIFVLGSNAVWAAEWNEAKLEVRLYDGNDRAWRFWEQAQLATTRQSSDALEGMLMCVLLGFSGEKVDDTATLSGWVATTKLQLGKGRQGPAWSAPPGLEPETNVPPLEGRPRLRTMLLVACGVLLALVPLVALLLARRWS